MKAIMEKLLNDKTFRTKEKIADIAVGQNDFATWD
jgi:hypothetical protein